ncbi:MAG: hypothetical protein AAF289_22180, partial [Cyanobacteria bacterium P01_A01_bin.135]
DLQNTIEEQRQQLAQLRASTEKMASLQRELSEAKDYIRRLSQHSPGPSRSSAPPPRRTAHPAAVVPHPARREQPPKPVGLPRMSTEAIAPPRSKPLPLSGALPQRPKATPKKSSLQPGRRASAPQRPGLPPESQPVQPMEPQQKLSNADIGWFD